MTKQKQKIDRKPLEREKERLEKEQQALQLVQFAGENRQKFAEDKLSELGVTDNLSEVTDEFQ